MQCADTFAILTSAAFTALIVWWDGKYLGDRIRVASARQKAGSLAKFLVLLLKYILHSSYLIWAVFSVLVRTKTEK